MAHTTPLARTKTAALSRVLDLLPKGYTFYTSGECPAEKALALARKFHARYGIGCTPAERITRKARGEANALLVMYWAAGKESSLVSDLAPILAPREVTLQAPDETTRALSGTSPEAPVSWLLLVTGGTGAVWESEKLISVLERRRLVWLGYELVRHSSRGKTAWTWRRTKEEMTQLYALLAELLNRHHDRAAAEALVRIARQPGFAGVREQSWTLCGFARSRGFTGELPHLFYVQKVSHGEPLLL